MKIDWKKLIICILIPIGVGTITSFLTMGSMETFDYLNKPPLSPSGIVFPIVWSILYVLMGISSYLVIRSGKEYRTKTALTVYGIQLILGLIWSLVFFNLEGYLAAFFLLIILLATILVMTFLFYKLNKISGYLMIPYIIWVFFAGYLNFMIFLLN